MHCLQASYQPGLLYVPLLAASCFLLTQLWHVSETMTATLVQDPFTTCAVCRYAVVWNVTRGTALYQ